ncbi:MAG: ABC transporter permease subunit [Deltaproteobacteria bacterium]|nr:ABC transporter permease subunit [Deltaproteobacteria bacterium]
MPSTFNMTAGLPRAPKSSLTGLFRSPWFDVGQFLVVIGLLVWFFLHGTEHLGYHWQWYRVPQYLFSLKEGHLTWGPLAEGILITFHLSAVGLVFSFVFGLLTALFRLSNSFTARLLARGYLELIRNTPLMVQIFILSPLIPHTILRS